MRHAFACICAALLATVAHGEPKEVQTVEQEFEVAEEKVQEIGNAENDQPDKEELAHVAEEGSEPTLIEEWDKHMEGFVPELLLTFPLAARTEELFFEDVDDVVLVRGGFFAAAADETSSVDFKITTPSGAVIFEHDSQPEGLFHFMAEEKGTYTFTVSNHKWMETKMVTFALGSGNNTHLTNDHLDGFDVSVKAIDRTLRDIQTESTYLWIRQKSHMKAVEGIHSRVFWICVAEFLVMVCVSGFQIYYMKGMLSDRRVL